MENSCKTNHFPAQKNKNSYWILTSGQTYMVSTGRRTRNGRTSTIRITEKKKEERRKKKEERRKKKEMLDSYLFRAEIPAKASWNSGEVWRAFRRTPLKTDVLVVRLTDHPSKLGAPWPHDLCKVEHWWILINIITTFISRKRHRAVWTQSANTKRIENAEKDA